MHIRPFGNRAILYFFLTIIFILTIFPIYWITVTSLKPESDVMEKQIRLIPRRVTLENYILVFKFSKIPRHLLNSSIVAILTTFMVILITSLGGYALARYSFPGKKIISFTIYIIQMFPIVIILVPLFRIFSFTGLMNNLFGLSLCYSTFMITFCTLMMRSFFETFPKEIEESAVIDGCSTVKVLFYVTVPVCLPGIVATGIFAFIFAWNELILATMFLNDMKILTLPVALNSIVGQFMVEWGQIAAGATLGLIPTILFFALIQKHLVSGVASGGLKG